jgi:hypothetical protein
MKYVVIFIIIIIIIIAIATGRPRLHSHQSDAPQYIKTLDSTGLERYRYSNPRCARNSIIISVTISRCNNNGLPATRKTIDGSRILKTREPRFVSECTASHSSLGVGQAVRRLFWSPGLLPSQNTFRFLGVKTH